MIRILIPLVMLLIGMGGGVGAAMMLRPAPDPTPVGQEGAQRVAAPDAKGHAATEPQTPPDGARDYVKLNNQFVVPVVADKAVSALVVLSLSIEVAQGDSKLIYSQEPKLRDALLQVLFDHANMGGFDGDFTNAGRMDVLRMSLTEAAQKVVGGAVTGVLITNLARQDI